MSNAYLAGSGGYRARLPRFDFAAPEILDDACKLLAEPEAYPLAGGTDLLPKMRRAAMAPRLLVALEQLEELRGIALGKDGLRIGATTTIAEIESHAGVQESYAALADAAHHTATVQVRNMGTLGGNICNASPCADNVPSLIAMDARATITGPAGERTLPVADIVTGPSKNSLGPGELLKGVFVPTPAPGTGVAYRRGSARSQVDLASVSVAVLVQMDGEMCHGARIVLGAVGPTQLRATDAEQVLMGQTLSEAVLAEAARRAMAAAKPISDVRASRQWRRHMVGVLTRRALAEAAERAKGVRS